MRNSFLKIVLLGRKKYNFNKHASNFDPGLPLITKILLLISEKSNEKETFFFGKVLPNI